jgi:hypothetical protein
LFYDWPNGRRHSLKDDGKKREIKVLIIKWFNRC